MSYWKSDQEVFAAGQIFGVIAKAQGSDGFYLQDGEFEVDENGNFLRTLTIRNPSGTLFRVTVEEVSTPDEELADLVELQRELTTRP